ncbi:putative monovalent cation/H+ antiporter subunit F [Corynebacterium atrinae]|uniref:cation:proton antiporter n=1 Tax=Corynebacterium atrinae TaxID=1336740 RepID=UPI0025B3CA14|nr:cation:proton antiporter [Corynebacterium atrinae]WJY62338.1 putative monovalent cation/H+ antiporter subunit F [Corynebacterium atrinae]
MTPFEWILTACIAVMVLALLSGLILLIKTSDFLTRAVLSDLVFYSMICVYLTWTLTNATSIAYEVAILAAIAGGVLPTLSMARIISRGRR